MSVWYDIEDKEDISFSDDGKEMHICFRSTREGNEYVSVPMDMINEILKQKT
jgi:hypothetical protein